MANKRDFIVKNGLQVLGQGSGASTSTTTGALIVGGGIGATGTINAGDMYSNSALVITTATLKQAGIVNNLSAGTGISLSTTTGAVTVTNVGVTSLSGSSYIGVSASTGSVTLTNLGVQTLTAGTDTVVTSSTGTVTVYNNSTLQTVTDRGAQTSNALSITNASVSNTTTNGALTVAGGVGVGGNLNVAGTMNVYGATTFSSEVTFSGTATFVYSTNTYYTDNIIDLHIPPGGIGSTWSQDDGKDVGLRFNYYNRTSASNANAAIVLANDTQMFEFYKTGAESNTGTFSSGVYGGVRLGTAFVLDTTDAATASGSGALQVTGGASIAKSLYVGTKGYIAGSEILTRDTIGNNAVASIIAGSGISVNTATGNVTVTNTGVTTATGSTYIGVSTSSGAVTFTNLGVQTITAGADLSVTGNTGTVTVSNTSTLQSVTGRGAITNNAISITNTTAASDTSTGALTVAGGVGVAKDLYAARLFDAGSRVVTSVTVTAGTGLTGGGTVSGPSGSITIDNVGVTSLAGSTYISVSTSTGSVTLTNLGVQTLTAGTDTVVTSSTGTVTVYNNSTLQSVTDRGTTTTNALNITNTSIGTSTSTGQALLVAGGIGAQRIVANEVIVGGNQLIRDVVPSTTTGISVTNVSTSGGVISFTINNTGVTSAVAGTDISVDASTGTVTISNTSTLQTVTGRGAVTSNALTLSNSSISTSTTSSNALSVVGGIGAKGLYVTDAVWINGNKALVSSDLSALVVSSLTAGTGISVSTATGAVTVSNVGVTSLAGSTYISVSANTGSVTLTNLGVQTLTAGTDTVVTSSTGTVTVYNNSTLQTVTDRGAQTSNALSITNTTNASSSSTGAVTVAGGVGVAKDLNVGGNVVVGPAGQVLSFQSASTSTTDVMTLDAFAVASYRTAKYVVQVTDGTDTHVEELLVFTNGTNQANIVSYAIGYNNGSLGDFDAVIAGGNVKLQFTPSVTPSALIVKTLRTAIAA